MASKVSIAQSCVQGITTAYSKYFELTGGLALGWAPESFIQTEIAAALFEDRAVPYVSLESCVYTTLAGC